jgi:hypothetical protein
MSDTDYTVNQEIQAVMDWVEEWKTARIAPEGVYFTDMCKPAPNCAQDIILLALRNFMR